MEIEGRGKTYCSYALEWPVVGLIVLIHWVLTVCVACKLGNDAPTL